MTDVKPPNMVKMPHKTSRKHMYKYLIHTLDPPPMSPKDPDMKRAPAYKSAWKELDFKFTVVQNRKCPPTLILVKM